MLVTLVCEMMVARMHFLLLVCKGAQPCLLQPCWFVTVCHCWLFVLQAWQSAVPRDVLEGLLASEDLRHTHNLQGVAGCLVDLMDVPPQLVTAVDVVAGNQLFQV